MHVKRNTKVNNPDIEPESARNAAAVRAVGSCVLVCTED